MEPTKSLDQGEGPSWSKPIRFSWNMKQELWSLNSKGQQLKQDSYGVYSLDTWRSEMGHIRVIGALKKGPNDVAHLD
jgi:hypothetical protein